jgi:hypothetical protein
MAKGNDCPLSYCNCPNDDPKYGCCPRDNAYKHCYDHYNACHINCSDQK